MAEQPRILLLGPLQPALAQLLEERPEVLNVVSVGDLSDALNQLSHDSAESLVINRNSAGLRERLLQLTQADRVLDALADGIAVVDLQMRVLWANRTFRNWSRDAITGRNLHEALGWPKELFQEQGPFRRALVDQAAFSCFQSRDNRYYELHVTSLTPKRGPVTELLTLCRDVTDERIRQRRLDALHQIGNRLAPLSSEDLAEMSVEERIALVKHNVRDLTRDLLHYDVMEIRMLDPQSRRLEPLISEGMPAEISERRLTASEEGSGVTGYVAATGKTYRCPSTADDPRYVEGAPGARSSLTVPLVHREQVIGTLNIESPKLDAFSTEDVQYVETFSREIAGTLYTLELLTAEKKGATERAIEAVNREVALPVDDILATTASLLDKHPDHDDEVAAKLRTILSNARAMKWSIQKVGQDLTPEGELTRTERQPFKEMRVLVADSDERVRRSAHLILGRWGCVVEAARDAREALYLARQSKYDAVLADIRLPDLSGYDAYCQLRQALPKARVILMTSYGYDPSHSLVKARRDGLQSVLYKPFRIDQLRDALSQVESGDTESQGE